MKKIALLLILMLAGLLSLTACGKSEEVADENVKVWKFAHEESVGSIQDMYAMKFKELVEERSNGKIKVDVYPVGQLGDGVGAVELIRYNAVNFSINNPATVATIVPENQLLSLQFVFSDDMEVNRKVLNEGNAIKEINKLYREKDIIPLAWFQEGFQVITSNHPINKPDDMKGFKLRVMASPLLIASYSAYGANPTPVPYMETYSNLQLNMIDGQVNPVFAIEEMKFYEVQQCLNFLNQEIFVGTFCVNPNFWDSLTDEERDMVLEITKELDSYIFDTQNEYAEVRLQKIKEDKPEITLKEYTEEERAAFKEKAITSYDWYLNLVGEEGQTLLDMLEDDIKQTEENMKHDT